MGPKKGKKDKKKAEEAAPIEESGKIKLPKILNRMYLK